MGIVRVTRRGGDQTGTSLGVQSPAVLVKADAVESIGRASTDVASNQQPLPQGGKVVIRSAHTRKTAGATPAPATIMHKNRQ